MKIPRRDLWTGRASIVLPPASVQELAQLKHFIIVVSTACLSVLLVSMSSMTPVGVALMAVSGALMGMLVRSAGNCSRHSDQQTLVLTRLMREGVLPEAGVAFIRAVADIERPLTVNEAHQLIMLGLDEQDKRQRDELYAIAKSSGGNAGEQ